MLENKKNVHNRERTYKSNSKVENHRFCSFRARDNKTQLPIFIKGRSNYRLRLRLSWPKLLSAHCNLREIMQN